MEHTVQPCPIEWCTDQPPGHTRHEGVLLTLPGHDPYTGDLPRWVQLVAFAQEMPGRIEQIRPQLGLTITGPDLSRPDRVSVTLASGDWWAVAEQIRGWADV